MPIYIFVSTFSKLCKLSIVWISYFQFCLQIVHIFNFCVHILQIVHISNFIHFRVTLQMFTITFLGSRICNAHDHILGRHLLQRNHSLGNLLHVCWYAKSLTLVNLWSRQFSVLQFYDPQYHHHVSSRGLLLLNNAWFGPKPTQLVQFWEHALGIGPLPLGILDHCLWSIDQRCGI